MFEPNEGPTYYAVLLEGNVSIPLNEAEKELVVEAMENRERMITVTDECGAETSFAPSKVCAIRKTTPDVRKADNEWAKRLHREHFG